MLADENPFANSLLNEDYITPSVSKNQRKKN